MMKLRGGIIACTLAVITAGVWCALYFTRSVNTEPRIQIFTANCEDIKHIHITGDENFTLKNSGNGWEIADMNVSTDEMSVNNYLSSMFNLKGKLIARSRSDLSEYGLDLPRISAEYVFRNGNSRKLYLGNKTPPQTEYYLADEEGNVYTIYTADGDLICSDVSSLADTFIYGIDYDDIQTITVIDSLVFTKNSDGAWYKDDTQVSEELIRQKITRYLGGMYAQKLIRATDENKAIYGVENPQAEIRITSARGKEDVFYIGDVTEDGTYFMTDKNDVIYRVINSYFDYAMSGNDIFNL